jgi:predicted DCC family thiol-disulfide oxidoreductase YuxK
VDSAGRVYSGADAWARIGLVLRGWKLIFSLIRIPGIHFVARRVYAWIARNRYRWNRDLCDGGTCALHVHPPTNAPKSNESKP